MKPKKKPAGVAAKVVDAWIAGPRPVDQADLERRMAEKRARKDSRGRSSVPGSMNNTKEATQ